MIHGSVGVVDERNQLSGQELLELSRPATGGELHSLVLGHVGRREVLVPIHILDSNDDELGGDDVTRAAFREVPNL